MYVVSSYLMIHATWFNTYNQTVKTTTLELAPTQLLQRNWDQFLKTNRVTGRFLREITNSEGDLVKEYGNASSHHKITLIRGTYKVKIESREHNLQGTIVGFHRTRGFEGPFLYDLYAILLDAAGSSLLVFAITGAILWLHSLKKDRLAWIIFGVGFMYVVAIMACLMII
jgi:hypothetical protein